MMRLQFTETIDESKYIAVQSMPGNTLFLVIPKVISNNLSIKKQDYVHVSQKNYTLIKRRH